MTENNYVANIRLPRSLWDEWGRQVGTGDRRRGGRSERVVAFIKAEVERNRALAEGGEKAEAA